MSDLREEVAKLAMKFKENAEFFKQGNHWFHLGYGAAFDSCSEELQQLLEKEE